jgi:hypothetical protein
MQINQLNNQITFIDLINIHINMYDKVDLIPIEVNNLTVNKLPDSTVSRGVNSLTVNKIPDSTVSVRHI